MTGGRERRVGGSAPLALVAALYLVPLLFPAPLVDPDEGLHAAISREMVEGGDWVMPHLLGTPFLDKPILFFWSQAAAMRVLGPTETAVRLPGAIFGLGGALALALLAWTLGARTGLTAALVYATMALPLAIAQVPVHDIALVPFVVLALAAFWRAAIAPRPWLWSAAAGVCLGLAILTKGLAGLAVAGLAHAGLLLWTKRLRLPLVAGGALAIVVAVAIAAPWYVAMEARHPGYLYYFVVERHLLGFATETQLHANRPWWYYLPILAGGALPWTVFVRARAGSGTAAARLGWVWLASGTAFLSAAGSKLVTYVLPVFPAVALLSALAWDDDVRDATDGRRRLRTTFAALAGALVLPATAAASEWVYGVPLSAIAWPAVVAVTLAWTWFVVRVWSGRALATNTTFDALTSLMALGALTAMLVVFPRVATVLTARDVAHAINARGRFPSELWIFDERTGSVAFYLDPALRRTISPQRIENAGVDDLLARRQPPPDVLVAVSVRNLARLRRFIDVDAVAHVNAGTYRLYDAEALHDAVVGRTR